MKRRNYRLGRRQASVDGTKQAVLDAARELVAAGSAASVGDIAARAGVSRITVYNRFGSRARLLEALAPLPPKADRPEGDAPEADAKDALSRYLERTTSAWAANPGLYRHLPPAADDTETSRRLAGDLLAADALRPGCSIREAEDVISALGSFGVFDRLHKDGRRSPAAVTEILMRMAGGILG